MSPIERQWLLAKMPGAARARGVGDVETTELQPTNGGWQISTDSVKTALENVSKAVWLSLAVGAVVGGFVGYQIGKRA